MNSNFSNLSLILICLTFMGLNQTALSEAKKPDNTNTYRSLETLARGLFYLENMYVEPDKVARDRMVENALQGIVSKLDPHTMLMPSQAFKQLTIDTQGKFGGIGIIVSSERGKLIVVSPIEDTPAFRAGIKSGDEIIAIDGTLIRDIKNGATTDKMRGRPDTEIKLTIKRKDEEKPLEFTLVREIIKIRSVKSREMEQGFLYARITSFQENTAEELREALAQYTPSLKGLILDLRDNPGGLLDQAVRVVDLFIDSGLIVSTVGRKKEDVEREFATKRGTFSDFPIITLINGGSASASEIVAGALQDHERSLIMGTTSFGKGSVQTLVSLPDRSGLKITVARYYTPKDRSIQAKGITPDIVVNAAKSKPAKNKKERPNRTEADLKGHIESEDLSDLAKESGLQKTLDKWTKQDRKDNQLVTAYKYLRAWGLMQRKN